MAAQGQRARAIAPSWARPPARSLARVRARASSLLAITRRTVAAAAAAEVAGQPSPRARARVCMYTAQTFRPQAAGRAIRERDVCPPPGLAGRRKMLHVPRAGTDPPAVREPAASPSIPPPHLPPPTRPLRARLRCTPRCQEWCRCRRRRRCQCHHHRPTDERVALAGAHSEMRARGGRGPGGHTGAGAGASTRYAAAPGDAPRREAKRQKG